MFIPLSLLIYLHEISFLSCLHHWGLMTCIIPNVGIFFLNDFNDIVYISCTYIQWSKYSRYISALTICCCLISQSFICLVIIPYRILHSSRLTKPKAWAISKNYHQSIHWEQLGSTQCKIAHLLIGGDESCEQKHILTATKMCNPSHMNVSMKKDSLSRVPAETSYPFIKYNN